MASRTFAECFDLVYLTLSYLKTDYRTLSDCAVPTAQILSAKAPRYAPHVQTLYVGGLLPDKAPNFPRQLAECLATFTNLQHLILAPLTEPGDAFADAIRILPRLGCLKRLVVGWWCHSIISLAVPEASVASVEYVPHSQPQTPALETLLEEDEEEDGGEGAGTPKRNRANSPPDTTAEQYPNADEPPMFSSLEALTIYSPPRMILDALPTFLLGLSRIRELHLLDNCGSITPGVLTQLIDQLEGATAFSIGLSYSLTDATIFNTLATLHNLTEVQLTYYLQLNSPRRFPKLPNLRVFSVLHPRLATGDESRRFAAWVRRAIAGTSKLEALHLVCIDDEPDDILRALISHLIAKHAKTLRVLDAGTATYVSKRMIRQLCSWCTGLEELHLCTGKASLAMLSTELHRMPHLHTARFLIKNARYLPLPYNGLNAKIEDPEWLRGRWMRMCRTARPLEGQYSLPELILLHARHGRLRWLSIGDIMWESAWRVGEGGAVGLYTAMPRHLTRATRQAPVWVQRDGTHSD
ncbi:hypothetical protein HDZ31DRAFT_41431 [Schizophyllum fasciatum]